MPVGYPARKLRVQHKKGVLSLKGLSKSAPGTERQILTPRLFHAANFHVGLLADVG